MKLHSTTKTICALLAGTAFASPALAQNPSAGTVYQQLDQNGVDATQLTFNLAIPAGSVGQGQALLSHIEYLSGPGSSNLGVYFSRRESGSTVIIDLTFGNRKETFTGAKTASSFASGQGTGATLSKVSTEEYLYKGGDGSQTRFKWPAVELR